jgi:hypothetical protein
LAPGSGAAGGPPAAPATGTAKSHGQVDVELHLSPQEAERVLNETMRRLTRTFERAARRWERVAYPGVVFLMILALLGFYQIRTLSNDMRMIAERIDPQMETHMARVADNMSQMTQQMAEITKTMQAMNLQIVAMQKDTAQISQGMVHMSRLQSIDAQMGQMNHNVHMMVGQMDGMRYDMSAMSRSVGKPLNMMNRFIPW